MAEGWKADKAKADKYYPEIVRVVKCVAKEIIDVRVATDQEDQEQATDYVVTVSGGEIGCRVRDFSYWARFGDVTFRSSRPSGHITEVQKILDGYGRWYLYAWARHDGRFGAWVVFDLDLLRGSGLLEKKRQEIDNKDGSSRFVPVSLHELYRAGCLVRVNREAWAKISQS